MILEQGLALDELPGMKTSLELEAQEESGGEQLQPTVGAAGTDAVLPISSEISDGEGVAARREGDVPAETGKHSNCYSPTAGV